MAITGVISLARAGETVQVFQDPSDLNDIFDPNAAPALQDFDHVTIYPADFTNIDPIEIPQDVYLTILPGAKVSYAFNLFELDRAARLEERYEDISGNVENVADLNIAHLYETSIESQGSKVRRYKITEDSTPRSFVEYETLGDAAEDAEEKIASESGNYEETIVVFPGFYAPEQNLFVNNVTWKFLPGAKIRYAPDWETGESAYALFDDSVDANGTRNQNPRTTRVEGSGEFIIGKGDDTPLEFSPFENEWENWNREALILLSNSSSNLSFNANRVRMQNTADAAIKHSNSDQFKINVDKLEFGPQNKIDDNLTSEDGVFDGENPPLPSFFVGNGKDIQQINSVPSDVEINVGEVNIEIPDAGTRNSFPYLLSAVNANDSLTPFIGNVEASFEEHTGLENDQSIYIPETASPEKVLIKDSDISGQFYFAGNPFNVGNDGQVQPNPPKSKVIVKGSEISAVDNAPILLAGSEEGFSLSFSKIWLFAENELFTVKNNVGNTNFEIKVYQNSFANLPVQDYEQILHDELNNIAWSEDVESIR